MLTAPCDEAGNIRQVIRLVSSATLPYHEGSVLGYVLAVGTPVRNAGGLPSHVANILAGAGYREEWVHVVKLCEARHFFRRLTCGVLQGILCDVCCGNELCHHHDILQCTQAVGR